MQQVNGKTGKVEKLLHGTERVFSRPDTGTIKTLVEQLETKEDRIALGKAVYRMIKEQDGRRKEFTNE